MILFLSAGDLPAKIVIIQYLSLLPVPAAPFPSEQNLDGESMPPIPAVSSPTHRASFLLEEPAEAFVLMDVPFEGLVRNPRLD